MSRMLNTTALAAALIWLAAPPCLARDKVKVPKADKLQTEIDRLFSGDVSYEDEGEFERTCLKIDSILTKDKKNVALKSPAYWAAAIHQAWFAGKDRKSAKSKQLKTEPLMGDGEKVVTEFAYWGPAKYNPKQSYTLVLSVLPKGQDPVKYIESTWHIDELAKKEFILVAVAESDTLPISKDPMLIIDVIARVRFMFNMDADRWFFEGVGDACGPVQTFVSKHVPSRVAGMILRNPPAVSDTTNASMVNGLILHGGDTSKGIKVMQTYQTLDAEKFAGASVTDTAGATAKAAEWIRAHPGRGLPAKYTYTTLIDEDNRGENYTGTMFVIPAKRGEKTTVTVTYDKTANTVDIQAENLGEFELRMNDDLLDLDNEVAIIVNGTEVARRVFQRSLREMLRIALDDAETGRLWSATYRGYVPTEIEAPPEEGKGDGEKKDGDGEKKEGEGDE